MGAFVGALVGPLVGPLVCQISLLPVLRVARSRTLPIVRVVKKKTVFLENGVFVPYRKQVALTKNGEDDDLHSTHKARGLRSSEPENDKNGGCRSDKTTV